MLKFRLPVYFRPEIQSLRVGFFNQLQFPSSIPFFLCLFPGNRAFHGDMLFIPHQGFNLVFLGKAFCQTFAMLPNALYQVQRYANVEHPISLAGQ